MVRREIDIDEETDRILSGLAQDYEGDLGKAVADLIESHKTVEGFVEACEALNGDSLARQVERSERGFSQGRFTPWDEVKRQNKL